MTWPGETRKLNPGALVKAGFDKAIQAQYPLAVDNFACLRRVHPDKSPEELLTYMTKIYLGTVAATGAGAGATAAVPNGSVQVPAAIADLVVFLEASVLYTLSVAEIHGLSVEDIERRRLLVMSVLVGNSAATTTLEPLIGRSAPYWGRLIVKRIPMSTITKANKLLGPRFVTKYGVKQGAVVLGIQLPFLIGAAIGAGGNGLFGWFIVKAARKILGPPPESWDELSEPGLDALGMKARGARLGRPEDLPTTYAIESPPTVRLA